MIHNHSYAQKDSCNVPSLSLIPVFTGFCEMVSNLRIRFYVRNVSAQQPQLIMIELAIVFGVLAIIAAIFGFGGVASQFAGIAKILLVVFIILAIVMFIL